MRLYMDEENDVIEGAAGVAVAGLLEKRDELVGKKVVVVICGGNVSDKILNGVKDRD